jgi:hypothetical protein
MTENLTDFTFVRPPNRQNANDQYELESWKKQLDIHWTRRGIYEDNKMKLYSLIWGQSTKSTQSKLETHEEFHDCRTTYDSLKLIKILHELSLRVMIGNTNTKPKTKPKTKPSAIIII